MSKERCDHCDKKTDVLIDATDIIITEPQYDPNEMEVCLVCAIEMAEEEAENTRSHARWLETQIHVWKCKLKEHKQ